MTKARYTLDERRIAKAETARLRARCPNCGVFAHQGSCPKRGLHQEKSRDERFWEKVDTSGGPEACWPWTAGRDKDGYGNFAGPPKPGSRKPTLTRANRYVLGLSDSKVLALHSCHNPPCCNPAHLRPGTARENSDDRRFAGNSQPFEENAAAKLSWEVVEKIRNECGSARKVGNKYGVGPSTVSDIRNGKRWPIERSPFRTSAPS
jgi:hypothetical protein